MAKKAAKKKDIAKRVAAKRLRTRQKRQKIRKEGFEAKLEKILGNLDQKEVQTFLLGSATLLEQPDLDWVRFPADETARITKKYYEEHSEALNPKAEEGQDADDVREARMEGFEGMYADAISRLSTKPMLFRLKNTLHSLARRAREEGDRDVMMRAICAEAMFRADVHVSAHPILIVAYERARDEGLGEELPDVRGYSLLEERKGSLPVVESDEDESDADEEPAPAAEAAATGGKDDTGGGSDAESAKSEGSEEPAEPADEEQPKAKGKKKRST